MQLQINLQTRSSILFFFLFCQVLYRIDALSFKLSRRDVYIPTGRLVYLPCNVRGISDILKAGLINTTNESEDDVLNIPEAVTTLWYNNIGQLIHVGQFFTLYFSSTAPGELDLHWYHTAKNTKTEKIAQTHNIPSVYPSGIGSSSTLLRSASLESITCTVFGLTPITLNSLNIDNSEEEENAVNQPLLQTSFTLQTYTTPHIIWYYMVATYFTSADWWYNQTVTWCQNQKKINILKASPCEDVFIEKRQSSAVSSKKPIQLSVHIALGTEPAHLFSAPLLTKSLQGLSHQHSKMKRSLETFLLLGLKAVYEEEEAKKEIADKEVDDLADIRKQLKNKIYMEGKIMAYCPSGAEPIQPLPSSQHITLSNAGDQVANWAIGCQACGSGKAVHTAYSFGACLPCSRGYFRDRSAWPAASGCLPCPAGFITDRVGAESKDECHLNAGYFSRYGIRFTVWLWDNFVIFICNLARSWSNIDEPGSNNAAMVGDSRKKNTYWLSGVSPGSIVLTVIYNLVIATIASMSLYRVHLTIAYSLVMARQKVILQKMLVLGYLNLFERMKARFQVTQPITNTNNNKENLQTQTIAV